MEDRIYHSLGQLLLSITPPDARKTIVEAELTDENDHCRLLYDYITSDDKKQWFLPPSATFDGEIFDLLVELRKIFELNNLYPEGRPWRACVITLDRLNTQIHIDFNYP